MEILEQENFYNVINGYQDLFLDPASTPAAEKHKTVTTFNEDSSEMTINGLSDKK